MSEERTEEEALRRLASEYALLRDLVQALRQRVDLLTQLINSIENTLSSLEAMKKLKPNSVLIFPLGNLVYVKSKVIDPNKVLVNVGAGVVLEKSINDAIEYLKNRQKSLRVELESTVAQLRHASTRLQELGSLIERRIAKQG